MAALADLLKRPQPVIWLDSCDYAARLLAGGSAPWLDAAAFVAWQRKAQGLFGSDVVALPLVPAIDAWLGAHPDLRAAMATKARATYPLKTLLADEPLRAHLVELARGLRSGVAGMPLALVVPTPRAWVALASTQARGTPLEPTEDDADSGAAYVADFLRAFADVGVDVLLLEEAPGFTPASIADLACCQPLQNLAAHYRWDVGVHLPSTGAIDGPLPAFGFSLAGSSVIATDDFWRGAPAPTAALRFARIPPDAQPEAVLDRLAALKVSPCTN